MKYFIKFLGTPSGTAKAIATFKETTNCKISQAVGAIAGVHITILSLYTDSKADYYNRKKEYSINSQSVVGGNLLVSDFCTGFPGSVYDSRVLRHSAIYAKAETSQILNSPNDAIENITIHSLILGTCNNRDRVGILKARCRCLAERLASEIENFSNVIITCVVLHNMCHFNGEEYLD